jgi:glycerol-3-phosphate dehydrogenase
MQFSFPQRPIITHNLRTEQYDLLVIGGGITGAGIALDAASRGLKTALVEKNDFAFGTSSRSTKLIHGGLRYLKQLEFGLVKEVGSERAVVHNLAPHLVVPEKMLLPLSEKKGFGYWLTSLGLKLYDWLAGVKPNDQRKMLSRPQTLKHEPLLRQDDVKGGAIYAEYRTDDARLTIEIMKTAVQHGADCVSYTQVTEFVYEHDAVSGAVVTDHITNETYTIHARVVVNAAGPWVDELRELNQSRQGKRLHLTKGVHLVVPREKLPVQQAIYFDVDDGRMIFAIPRGRTTYIGTTDTNYAESKDLVFATADDAQYLIRAVNATFPSVGLTQNDIESAWAGLRPLIHEDGKSASELSRKDEIFESSTGLISIAGGKLTGYRKMAERVVNLVIKKHFSDRRLKGCFTQEIKLAGDGFAGVDDVKLYVHAIIYQLKPSGLSENTARYLVENYGRQAATILEQFSVRTTPEDADLRLLMAEAVYAAQHEMVVTLQDFFVRRTGLLYFDIQRLRKHKEAVANILMETLGWTEARKQQELKDLDSLLRRTTDFIDSKRT